jgi:hypothetical protein
VFAAVFDDQGGDAVPFFGLVEGALEFSFEADEAGELDGRRRVLLVEKS